MQGHLSSGQCSARAEMYVPSSAALEGFLVFSSKLYHLVRAVLRGTWLMLLKKQLQDLSGSVRIYFLIMEIRNVIENLAMFISSFLSERMFSLLVDSLFPGKILTLGIKLYYVI